MIAETSVFELAQRLAGDEDFILLDVREESELRQAIIRDRRLAWAPMSRLVYFGLSGLPPELTDDKDRPVVVICHQGVRSANAAAWLEQQGWTAVTSLAGGIDAYARQVDPGIGVYGE